MGSRSICIYCGSRVGDRAAYVEQATALGQAIADNGWRLVYGAGDIGLMGTVARAAQGAGAETFGVIPTHLVKAEVGKTDLTRYVVTENMHERKKVMFMNADAIVVMPGGAGSMDEFFEGSDMGAIGFAHQTHRFDECRGVLGPADRPDGSHDQQRFC
jgi:uncharacterized protein (TIGR00730 family)